MSHWLPQQWPKTVVSFETKADQDANGNVRYQPIGTGFVFAYKDLNCLATAKHVVVDEEGNERKDVYVAHNLKKGGIGIAPLPELKKFAAGVRWHFHSNPGVDLAVIPFPYNRDEDDLLRCGQDLFENFENVVEGDEVFFLGFPLGIRLESKVTPLVRGGIVSLKREDSTFLIDASVSVGNSGSPVFLKPSIYDFKTGALGSLRPPKFVGIISNYLSYVDVAVSVQTRRPRVTFEENSGLATVFSADLINAICDGPDFQNTIESLAREGKLSPRPS